MAILCMAVYDTEENGRSEYTERTIKSLSETVNFNRHELVIIDNNSCERTKSFLSRLIALSEFKVTGNFGIKIPNLRVISLPENVGTARAINMGLKLRKDGQNAIKLDNDVVIHQSGWVAEMEEVIRLDGSIGIVGLKRKDLRQTPYDPDPNFRSELRQLRHETGERWVIVEETNDIMGTCTMLSSQLLTSIGGYAQPLSYAFDDTLMNLRSRLSGFKNCFLPHIDIDHIDTGANPYSQEKILIAADAWPEYHKWHQAYIDGTRPLYEAI